MLTNESLDDANFLLFAAKYYDNPCHSTLEFLDDLKRFKYIKRLFAKYKDCGELKERLILNHLIVIYNVFNDQATPMLFLKMKGYEDCLKPFLVLLKRLPTKVILDNRLIHTCDIHMDQKIVEQLRNI